jgi:hypothetical protein
LEMQRVQAELEAERKRNEIEAQKPEQEPSAMTRRRRGSVFICYRRDADLHETLVPSLRMDPGGETTREVSEPSADSHRRRAASTTLSAGLSSGPSASPLAAIRL